MVRRKAAAWAYGGGQERPRWIADRLPGLCARLHASGSAGAAAAQRLVDLAWEWLAKDIGIGIASSSPSRRDEELGGLGGPLASFLEDTSRRTFEWPIPKERRQHVHSRIDAAELPVTHVTRRQGRPYTLVLNKTDALFTREQEARTRDEADLKWLAAEWNPGT